MSTFPHLNECYQRLWKLRRERVAASKEVEFSSDLLKSTEPLKAFIDDEGLPTVVFKIAIDGHTKNGFGKAHGGALTTIIDVLTFQGLLADPGYWELDKPASEQTFAKLKGTSSVSRKINVRFSRPVDVETSYFVTTKVLQNSKGGAFISARIHDAANKTYVFGVQDLTKLYKTLDTGKPKL